MGRELQHSCSQESSRAAAARRRRRQRDVAAGGGLTTRNSEPGEERGDTYCGACLPPSQLSSCLGRSVRCCRSRRGAPAPSTFSSSLASKHNLLHVTTCKHQPPERLISLSLTGASVPLASPEAWHDARGCQRGAPAGGTSDAAAQDGCIAFRSSCGSLGSEEPGGVHWRGPSCLARAAHSGTSSAPWGPHLPPEHCPGSRLLRRLRAHVCELCRCDHGRCHRGWSPGLPGGANERAPSHFPDTCMGRANDHKMNQQ